DASLRTHGAADRLPEVLAEVQRVRVEVGSPPLAAPLGQVVASQALVNVLSSSRWTTVVDEVLQLVRGEVGEAPGPVGAGVARAIELVGNGTPAAAATELAALEELRARYGGMAAAEEELLLLALFGDEAEALLQTIRARHAGSDVLAGGDVDR